jgi:hypothetical protein
MCCVYRSWGDRQSLTIRGSVQARSSRVVVLVAFLVMHAGSAQARQHIAGLLWPGAARATS